MKLATYYFSHSEYTESKKYLIKIFEKLKCKFEIKFVNNKPESLFDSIKNYILNCPLFNLINQPNLNQEFKRKHKLIENLNVNKNYRDVVKSWFLMMRLKEKQIMFQYSKKLFNIKHPLKKADETSNETIICSDVKKLFNFIILNKTFRNIFNDEINKIIKVIQEIIYTPPYQILFGRINFVNSKTQKFKIKTEKDIDEFFL